MINIKSINNEEPYNKYMELYDLALKNNQNQIERILIASYDKNLNEVNARYVNLKYIYQDQWTFFSNYNSVKAKEFLNHNQITAVSYWSSIDVQIRIKAIISKSNKDFSDKHYASRSNKKNALAVSSYQSETISSYQDVEKNYNHALESNDLLTRPSYWGGYTFRPFYFEFWKGHESRINRREVHKIEGNCWKKSFLNP